MKEPYTSHARKPSHFSVPHIKVDNNSTVVPTLTLPMFIYFFRAQVQRARLFIYNRRYGKKLKRIYIIPKVPEWDTSAYSYFRVYSFWFPFLVVFKHGCTMLNETHACFHSHTPDECIRISGRCLHVFTCQPSNRVE